MTISRSSTEPELRAGGAGCAPPGAGALIEEARQRRRRRWRRRAFLGASLVLLAAAAATGAVGLSGPGARSPAGRAPPVPAGPVASMPSRVVVWTGDSKIEILSSRAGRVIRTLARNIALFQRTPTLAVSPAGVLYFDDARGSGRDAGEWVLSVPLAGGPVTAVAQGRDPAVSPDGQLLGYVSWTDPSCSPGSLRCPGKPEAIVIRDLLARTQRTWAFTSLVPVITNLSWSPDGRYLAFTAETSVKNGTVMVRTAQVLDVRSGGTLDDAPRISLGRAVAWAGYLTPQTGVGVMVGPDGAIQAERGLVEIRVSNGRVIRRLTSLPSRGLGTGNAFDGAENTIAVDRTGRYLLIVGMGDGHGEIYRWTAGMRRPVRVTAGAFAAAWAG